MLNQNKVILTGIQASGDLHLGNYIGSGLNLVKTITENPNALIFLMIADLHALTTFDKTKNISKSAMEVAKFFQFFTQNFKNTYIFRQSQIAEHSELFWILNSFVSLGHLQRMTQFKDKKGKNHEDSINAGLLNYPILQAADILLYDSDFVPVGIDQKQHIEFTADIAQKINNTISPVFTIPKATISTNETHKIMSLKDGTKKMSKSDESDMSRINLTDNAEIISSKIKKAKTDSISQIYHDKVNRPEISNLLNIMSALSGEDIKNLEVKYNKEKSTPIFKSDLSDLIVQKLSAIQSFMHNASLKKLEEDEQFVKKIAQNKLQQVKKVLGL